MPIVSTDKKSNLKINHLLSHLEKDLPPGHKSSVYLRALLEHTDDSILICDEKGVPQLYNSSYAAMMKEANGIEMHPGIQPHKLLKDPVAVAYWESLHEKALAGEHHKTQYTHLFSNNDLRHFELTLYPMFEDLKVIGFLAIGTDITAQKKAEEALLESEERFRKLFNSSPTAMAITEEESGKIVDVNSELCSIWNYRKEEIIGRTTTEAVFSTKENRDLFKEELNKSGFVNEMEVEIPVKNGTKRTVKTFSRLISLSGKPHIISSFFDITDSRQLELGLRQTQRMEAIGTLTAGIAHDYNNMLTVILGNISLAKQASASGDKIQKFLASAEEASLKIKGLTTELMSLSWGEALKRKPGNLRGLLHEAAANAVKSPLLRVAELIPNNLWPVLHDSTHLRFVLQNILTNAAESTGGKGEIILEAKNINMTSLQQKKKFPIGEGPYVKISVTDQGVGIPGESLSKIFDPYFSTKEKGEKKGLGLGLATAYNVIKKHEGYIAVESKEGAGTTVNIYLPAITDRTA